MSSHLQFCRAHAKRSRGLLAIELLFILPILMALLLAAVAYAHVLTVRSTVTQAATVAAREAGKGAAIQEIVEVANRILATQGMTIGATAGSGAKLAIDDGLTGRNEYGDPQLVVPQVSETLSDEVRATFCVRIPGPNILFAFCGRQLTVASAVKKEDFSAADSVISVAQFN